MVPLALRDDNAENIHTSWQQKQTQLASSHINVYAHWKRVDNEDFKYAKQ